jgi:FK506-binding protein 4/5
MCSPPVIPAQSTLRFEVELISFEKDPETVEEKLGAATKLKDRGNALFKEAKYQDAYNAYQQAVDLFRWAHGTTTDETDRVDALRLLCHLNQAACQLKQGSWAEARACCDKALDLDSKNVKALFRRGQAFTGMAEFDRARQDINDAIRLDPENADLKREIERIQREETNYLKKQKDMYSKMGQMFK